MFFEYLAVLIGSLEINRALQGWKKPGENAIFQQLEDDYFPGDIGFDPLGLKPDDPDEFLALHTKELQNGRLVRILYCVFYDLQVVVVHVFLTRECFYR